MRNCGKQKPLGVAINSPLRSTGARHRNARRDPPLTTFGVCFGTAHQQSRRLPLLHAENKYSKAMQRPRGISTQSSENSHCVHCAFVNDHVEAGCGKVSAEVPAVALRQSDGCPTRSRSTRSMCTLATALAFWRRPQRIFPDARNTSRLALGFESHQRHL